MDTDNTGYIPNMSARIQAAIRTDVDLLTGGPVMQSIEFHPGRMSDCLLHFTAKKLSTHWFFMELSFHSGFSFADGRYYSYLGVKVDHTDFGTLFRGNYKLVSTPEYRQLISSGSFYMYAVGTSVPAVIQLRPLYTHLGSGYSLINDYEPFEI